MVCLTPVEIVGDCTSCPIPPPATYLVTVALELVDVHITPSGDRYVSTGGCPDLYNRSFVVYQDENIPCRYNSIEREVVTRRVLDFESITHYRVQCSVSAGDPLSPEDPECWLVGSPFTLLCADRPRVILDLNSELLYGIQRTTHKVTVHWTLDGENGPWHNSISRKGMASMDDCYEPVIDMPIQSSVIIGGVINPIAADSGTLVLTSSVRPGVT